MMRRMAWAWLTASLLVAGIPALAAAQLTTGAISGTASDDTKAVLPGTTVTVTNVETGVARTAVTNEHGHYRVANLPVGGYQVEATLSGFQTAVRSGIELTVGREAVVDLTLRIGDMNERIVVTGEAPLVDLVRGSLGDVVDGKAIQELPLNSRDLAQLVTLQTGAASYRFGRQEGGAGLRLSVGGGRPTGNVLLMDGVALESYHGYVPTGSSETFLGVEAVREFKVETNAYSAEFGRSSGGVFNVITKSGTNDLHGSGFEFLRNDALDAKNFFDAEKPPFRRNQFGFSLGGRVVRNKTFFFGTYEGLRERLGTTTISRTFTSAIRQTPMDPRIAPYLAVWPLPNGPVADYGNGTGDYSFTESQPTDEDFYQGRVDQQLSASDSVFGRYTTLGSTRLLTEGFPQFRDVEQVRNQYLTLEYKKILSTSLLNTARFGYSSTDPKTRADQDAYDPALRFVPQVPLLGGLEVTGLSPVGQAITGETRRVISYQFIDDLSIAAGRHALKVGVNWNHIVFDGWNPARDAGLYTFNSITDFFAARPSRFRGGIAVDYNDAFRVIRQNIIGLYTQDDIQFGPRFTLNAGVRYEFITVPTEEKDRLGNFRGDVAFAQRASIADISLGDPWFKNPSLANVAPRVGFAWDVFGGGRTAVRGGFGVFHLQFNQTWVRTTAFRMPPFLIEMQATSNVPFPNIFQTCGSDNPLSPQAPLCTARAAPDYVPYEMERNPYVMQYNLNVQHQVSPKMVVTVGYVGSRGMSLPGIADVNVPQAETTADGRLFFRATARPNPNFDDLRMRYPVANSSYNALQVSLNRRFSDGLQFRTSYAFAKSIDDTSGSQTAGDANGSTNWIPYYYDTTLFRGPSAFDVRHNFSFSSTYELPIGPGRRFGGGLTGLGAKLLEGWQLGGIVSLVSGFPGTVEIASRLTAIGIRTEFPDIVAGANANSIDPQNPSAYIDRSSFAFRPARTMGNSGRNTITQPGLANVDFSLTKNTYVPSVSHDFNVQFRFEVFNLLNRPNFGPADMVVFDNRGGANPTFGRITTTSTPARQIQLGLKFTF